MDLSKGRVVPEYVSAGFGGLMMPPIAQDQIPLSQFWERGLGGEGLASAPVALLRAPDRSAFRGSCACGKGPSC